LDADTRKDLAAWVRAFKDLDVEFLHLPPASPGEAREPEPPDSRPEPSGAPAGGSSAEAQAPSLFSGGGEEKDMPAPSAPGRGAPLAGAFPAGLEVLSDPELEPLQDPPPGEEGLRLIREVLGDCTRCRLHEGRTSLVFGAGSPEAEIVFVGEGPGHDEDIQGEPFVGRAGKRLDKMIKGMGYERGDVYIANVVKCRPPQNRNPAPDETERCTPFLHAQLAAIRPRVIVTLGLPAAQVLLAKKASMGALRGKFHEYRGIPVMPTYHPAYLLRSPGQNVKVAHDLALVLRLLGRKIPGWAAKALREVGP